MGVNDNLCAAIPDWQAFGAFGLAVKLLLGIVSTKEAFKAGVVIYYAVKGKVLCFLAVRLKLSELFCI